MKKNHLFVFGIILGLLIPVGSMAQQGGGPPGGPPGGGNQSNLEGRVADLEAQIESLITLGGLTCANDQIAKWNGSAWECAPDDDTTDPDWTNVQNIPTGFADGDDADTLGGLTCSSGQIAKHDGTNWACEEDNNSVNTDALRDLSCSSGQVAKWNGSVWYCAADNNTDTLKSLRCDEGQVPVMIGGWWECSYGSEILTITFNCTRVGSGTWQWSCGKNPSTTVFPDGTWIYPISGTMVLEGGSGLPSTSHCDVDIDLMIGDGPWLLWWYLHGDEVQPGTYDPERLPYFPEEVSGTGQSIWLRDASVMYEAQCSDGELPTSMDVTMEFMASYPAPEPRQID